MVKIILFAVITLAALIIQAELAAVGNGDERAEIAGQYKTLY